MLQRLIAAVLGVLGLVAIALGIASATAWRADDTLTATAQAADGTTLVTTAPGVLEMGDPPVTVRASADDGAKVVLALGRDTDVEGWVGTDAHTVITGLEDWHTLSVEQAGSTADAPAEGEAADAPAEGEAAEGDAAQPAAPATGPDPDGSDLWIEQVTGEGEAELVWTPEDGRWTVLAAAVGESASAPTVELSWPQTVTTPWLLPGVIGGAVLLLLALLLFLRSRRSPRTATAGADDGDGATALSRRERRSAAAEHEARRPEARQAENAGPTGSTGSGSSTGSASSAGATGATGSTAMTATPADTSGPTGGTGPVDDRADRRADGEEA